MIAFDKPFQVAYSGAPKDQAQLDRILQVFDFLKNVYVRLVVGSDKSVVGLRVLSEPYREARLTEQRKKTLL